MSWTGGDLSDLFTDAVQLAEDAAHDMAVDAGRYATEIARDIAPVAPPMDTRAPGTLRASYHAIDVYREQRTDGNVAFVSGVETFDHVARWVESGVRPHIVEAKPGKLLTFRTVDGTLVRVKRVTQRGYEGQHVVSRALTAAEFAFDDIASPALHRWVERQTAAANAR